MKLENSNYTIGCLKSRTEDKIVKYSKIQSKMTLKDLENTLHGGKIGTTDGKSRNWKTINIFIAWLQKSKIEDTLKKDNVKGKPLKVCGFYIG